MAAGLAILPLLLGASLPQEEVGEQAIRGGMVSEVDSAAKVSPAEALSPGTPSADASGGPEPGAEAGPDAGAEVRSDTTGARSDTAGARSDTAGAGDPDFFFGRPVWSVSLRAGAFLPRASGQFFDFAFDRFTLDREDFRSFTGGAELGVWVNDHLELTASVDVASTTRRSEYQEWWEETPQGDSLGIEQSTRLTHGPALALGMKVYPTARGEHLSRFIWVPHQVAPYLSFGVGGLGYELEQWGDWVVETGTDEGTIFADEFRTSDAAFITYVGAGLDYMFRPRIALNLDGRYIWGEDRMGDDFRDFDRPLDLSGLRLTAGLSYRF